MLVAVRAQRRVVKVTNSFLSRRKRSEPPSQLEDQARPAAGLPAVGLPLSPHSGR